MLSMFSAIAGAKHVYAIDRSNVVQMTRRIVADNKLTHKITVIKGKAAEITLPVQRVDVIVSSFLGWINPNHTKINVEFIDFLINLQWNVAGSKSIGWIDRCPKEMACTQWFDISGSVQSVHHGHWQWNALRSQQFLATCLHIWHAANDSGRHHRTVSRTSKLEAGTDTHAFVSELNDISFYAFNSILQVVSDPCLIKHMNLYTMEKDDYRRFDTPFRLECEVKTCVGALVTYFDVEFNEGLVPIRFTTTPALPPTQWRQLIFFLARNDFHLNRGDRFYGVFRFNAHDDDFRKIDWNIEVIHKSERSYFRDRWTFNT